MINEGSHIGSLLLLIALIICKNIFGNEDTPLFNNNASSMG